MSKYTPVPRAEPGNIKVQIMIEKQYRWEKQSGSTNVKYYIASIQQDLFGEWIIYCQWGRQNSRLGGEKCVAFGLPEMLDKEIEKIHRRKLTRGYHLISRIII